jgi:hypothetical protein
MKGRPPFGDLPFVRSIVGALTLQKTTPLDRPEVLMA